MWIDAVARVLAAVPTLSIMTRKCSAADSQASGQTRNRSGGQVPDPHGEHSAGLQWLEQWRENTHKAHTAGRTR